RPRLAPVPWTVVDRPRYLGSALAPATLTPGATWTFDAPTSARLTSCKLEISRGATVVRTLACDPASAADGDALVRWDGRDGAGRKTTHCVWFVFPQLAGLGRSATAQRFALASLAEAEQYVAHPVLGPRLLQCATVLLELPATVSARDVMGSDIDALKLHSST